MLKKIAEITTYEWYIFFRKKLEIYEKYVKSPHLGVSIFQQKMENSENFRKKSLKLPHMSGMNFSGKTGNL